ncbi:hypothetical protein BFW01_g27 [Lasiodiplodia theobromae]|uniref:Uncharacterized protein n=1 Tax=Lasiodiplodia theobromae TaxID=45133 RepID=A0A5N5D3G6_9PEZI|nr:Gpi transamidase component [Lasiodiplodia theobromae]KAB2572215.1 hypothetical protein DBV05_g9086 [Lasiodiplodia theobromae]KAF4536712.1 Gpi transamidase component [Lasiodiplodia theobromae]KAF9629846.1 hypothetical protein BFW01_g27 [Lasiodiplodia theobromae]
MGPKKLSAICIVSVAVPAASALALAVDTGLLRRADAAVCGGDSALSQCGSNFPSSFCCPSSTTCTALNDDSGAGGEATSVICCPEGQDCKFIRPITCDINQQNATLHPSNAIHTTNLTATLETCGSECCPLGYKCQSGLCAMISANDTSGSSTTSAAPSSTSISTPTGGSVTSGLGPAETSASATPLSEKHGGGSNKGAIAGGVIGGIALGILLTALGIWLWRRRQAAEKNPRYSGDFGPVSRTVSDPIYNPALGARTEFLRRDAASPPGNASIDHTLLGSPFSPMKEINKAGGLGRNGTMTTTNTSHSSGSATPLNPYGYARPNIPKRSPSKPYGNLTAGPGGGMAATSPKSPRIRGLFSRPSKSNLSEYPAPPALPMASGSVSPSVYTPTPAPRGPQRQRSSSTRSPSGGRQPMGPTRNFSLGPRRSQSLSARGDMNRERPRTGSTETIDVLMTGSNQPSGMGFLAPPPGIRVPGERPLTSETTFTRLMENAGYGRESRDQIKGWGNMGVAGHAADSPRNRI